MMLIAPPPTERCPMWLNAFAEEMMKRKAGLPWVNAISCAHIAHDASWLLDPEEAATLWLAAINAAVHEHQQHQLLHGRSAGRYY